MPTGYTVAVQEGIEFNDFVMQCARAMGALIMMRDEPSDAPIPERFEPCDYHAKKLKLAEENLAWLLQMPDAEAGREAKAEFEKEKEFNGRMIKESNDIRGKYESMLTKVRAWVPPTPEHEGFKEFMVKQLTESIDFDCNADFYEKEAPVLLTASDWKQKKIERARRDVERHREEHRKEVERTEGRNNWLRALRESLAA